jgi:hypothetical protein
MVPSYGETREFRDVHVEPEVRWAWQRGSPDYPCIVMSLDPTTITMNGRERLEDWVRREQVSDPAIAYNEFRGQEVVDFLNVYVAVASDHGGIPRHWVAHKLAEETYAIFRFSPARRALREPGDWPYEIPLEVRMPYAGQPQMENISDQPIPGYEGETEGGVQRWYMQFQVGYEMTRRVAVESVAAIAGETAVQNPGGTELSREPFRVEFNYANVEQSDGGQRQRQASANAAPTAAALWGA